MTLFRKAANGPTFYDTLGCPPAASAAALREAYYRLSREHHPDRGGDAEKFKAVALAYGNLKTPEFRAAYDARLRLERRLDCLACGGAGLRSGFAGGRYLRYRPCAACGGRGHL